MKYTTRKLYLDMLVHRVGYMFELDINTAYFVQVMTRASEIYNRMVARQNPFPKRIMNSRLVTGTSTTTLMPEDPRMDCDFCQGKPLLWIMLQELCERRVNQSEQMYESDVKPTRIIKSLASAFTVSGISKSTFDIFL